MFLKKDHRNIEEAVNKAYFITFGFWGFTLFINSFFELFHNRTFISNFHLLIAGLIIFFISDYIWTKILRKQEYQDENSKKKD